jgi:uncharacterized membrane protein YkvA (DUF1232 family)
MNKIIARRVRKRLKRLYKEAAGIMTDPEMTQELAERAEAGSILSGKSKGFLYSLRQLKDMLRDYHSGEYTLISRSTLLVVVAALLYIISPIDVIPDSIPIVGGLDDIAVLAYAVHAVSDELKNYRLWLATKDMRADEAIDLIHTEVSIDESRKKSGIKK